jgi:hypothetical protein
MEGEECIDELRYKERTERERAWRGCMESVCPEGLDDGQHLRSMSWYQAALDAGQQVTMDTTRSTANSTEAQHTAPEGQAGHEDSTRTTVLGTMKSAYNQASTQTPQRIVTLHKRDARVVGAVTPKTEASPSCALIWAFFFVGRELSVYNSVLYGTSVFRIGTHVSKSGAFSGSGILESWRILPDSIFF